MTGEYPSFYWSNGEGSLLHAYDGLATVEAGPLGGLVLTLPPGPGAGGAGGGTGAGGAGGAPAIGGRLKIGSTNRLPAFTVGAQVWLTKTEGPTQFSYQPPSGGAFAVRDRREGTLLFGGNEGAFPSVGGKSTLPVETGAVTAVCSGPASIDCAPSNTYYSVAFVGDASVILRDGERGEVTLGGLAYDVWVKAWREEPGCGGDAWPGDGFKYDVIAKNLADLAAGLPISPPGP